MLTLTIYGSSSKGNCYLLSNGTTNIMLDCGVKNIEHKLEVGGVDGIVITHSHSLGPLWWNKEYKSILQW